MKKKILILSMFIVAVAILVMAIKFPAYKEKRLGEMEKQNNSFSFFLFISGDCQVSYNKVEPKRAPQLPTQLKIFISCYNFYNEKDVSYEMLMDEYYNFCDGKSEKYYKNLSSFTEYMMSRYKVLINEIAPDNLDYNYTLDVCQQYLLMEYGLEHTQSEEYKSLTQEQVDGVCNRLFQQKEKMCYTTLNVGLEAYSEVPYGLMYTGFKESDMDTNEDGEKVVYSEDSSVCYYLEYGNINMLSDEKEWYVYKIELLAESEYSILATSIGKDMDSIKRSFGRKLQNVQLEEVDDKLIYQQGGITLTVNFANGYSEKITLEMQK